VFLLYFQPSPPFEKVDKSYFAYFYIFVVPRTLRNSPTIGRSYKYICFGFAFHCPDRNKSAKRRRSGKGLDGLTKSSWVRNHC
jgi:hypothetical protein